ncbi:ribosome hibernation-promoting factor, HPF/YfiA family [Candidatus Igneacidithiobacillus taiwanensis]|uniref:ribosome hibernation-promoting factor, HPF/YfiA family n=1 Tax=Candidatus Igneacidithiobacillus taiwanensis TaxID=1945924 RepID=UPI00289E3A47|nr:ribosome-associated translation inhibitor RaiA [Candidatus Igneacidithiobacillus taiwanensis]MCE5359845.1 ribosome-associated translation inhibitor RaiA [Acidithiobacillus sp.]
MQLHISGQHLDLTEAIKNHVTEKLGRLDHYFDRVIVGRVVLKYLGHEKLSNVAEISVSAPGHDFHAEARAADMYVAIDQLAEKIDGQVRQYKEKLQRHRGAPVAAVLASETE